jgi:DNA-binding HxlR family transcriptional regulator
MRRTSQYCPIARAADLLADRWTLVLLRDLLGGTTRFNELARGLPGLSRGLLAKRLRQLTRAGLVTHAEDQYTPTGMATALWPVLESLGGWAATWMFGEPTADELDPDLLMWWLHRHVPRTGFPDGRTTVQVDLTDARRHYWVLVTAGEASLCPTDPGFPPDVTLTTTCRTLYQVWQGTARVAPSLRAGHLEITGSAVARRAVCTWLDNGPLANLVKHATSN